jgi:two-component system chemotaxis sensor kinase CheA
VRVETERLDKLINLVGELVISRTQVIEMVKGGEATDRMGAVDQLDRITTELQYAAMSLRMVPIKQVFDRFPRMVRDLAQSRGKEINLEIFGETTELDRSIVNQIGDPLVHLIRNSIDHGIEPKEERIAKGKPGAGTIRLNARHEGSYILIEIMDDGKGLDVNRIRDKAVERNLLPEGTKEISMGEAVNLLFQPGFSTAEIVTDLSGRGVGLDAVKAVVESLSGTISVESEPGKSTRTTIKLPLTLAIIKALLVKVDGETVAIPIQAVRENIQIESEQIKTVQQRPVIMLRNEVLPLYDLAQCLGFTPVDTSGPLPVIIVEVRGSKVGFIVEDLIGQQEIVIKSLSGIVGDIKGVAGATILGNGRIALIIDNSTLIG